MRCVRDGPSNQSRLELRVTDIGNSPLMMDSDSAPAAAPTQHVEPRDPTGLETTKAGDHIHPPKASP